jgi:hypothetical protein
MAVAGTIASTSRPAPPSGKYTAATLCDLLTLLYEKQNAGSNHYLAGHARPGVIAAQVIGFQWYARFLPPHGRLLDWGCRHAPDACLIRGAFGAAHTLHGCDFVEPGSFSAFHDYAELDFTKLDHCFKLPYPDQFFDGVIASGTLEHAAMDYESLKELYRTLKPNAPLIITYLPYRYSYEEFFRRHFQKREYHRRLYSKREVDALLRHTGFVPDIPVQPTICGRGIGRVVRSERLARFVLAVAQRVCPPYVFASTLRVVARKQLVM